MGAKFRGLFAVCLLMAFSSAASYADIYQWVWVNPANHSYGKKQSTTLCPGGAGATVAESANLSGLDLTQAYLSEVGLDAANLTNTNLTNADLAYSGIIGANLTGANLTGADITGAYFTGATGLTLAQIYSTGNYQAGSLSQIGLDGPGDFSSGVFSNMDLTGTLFGRETDTSQKNLSNADFSNSNLSWASLYGTNLSGAVFTNANIAGDPQNGNTDFETATGLTLSQIYSTASYKAKNLQYINFNYANFSGADFGGQNLLGSNMEANDLTGANLSNAVLSGVWLSSAKLSGADFTNAIISCGNTGLSGAYLDNTVSRGFTAAQFYSTASYKAKDLRYVSLGGNDLTGWDFSGQNLQGAELGGGSLAGANFAGANITGTIIDGATGFTLAQIYSTASYQSKNLRGTSIDEEMNLGGVSYAGGDFSGQDISNGGISTDDFTNANFSGANLNNTALMYTRMTGANLTNANLGGTYLFYSTDFSGADLRGASYNVLYNAILTNTILSDGTVSGLHLTTGHTILMVRNYVSGAFYPTYGGAIHITGQMNIESGSTLQMVFDGATWHSTISFDSGIPVTLAGNLDLTLGDGVSPASLWGKPIPIFDWTGVNPTGQFTLQSNLPAGYSWDTTHLYDTGVIVEVPEPATLALLCLAGTAMLGCLRQRKPVE